MLQEVHFDDVRPISGDGKGFYKAVMAGASIGQCVGIVIHPHQGIVRIIMEIMPQGERLGDVRAISGDGKGFYKAVIGIASIGQCVSIVIHPHQGIVHASIAIMLQGERFGDDRPISGDGKGFYIAAIVIVSIGQCVGIVIHPHQGIVESINAIMLQGEHFDDVRPISGDGKGFNKAVIAVASIG